MFYREAQIFTIEQDDLSKFELEKVSENMEFSQLFFYEGSTLITRSSGAVLFIKKMYDEETQKDTW